MPKAVEAERASARAGRVVLCVAVASEVRVPIAAGDDLEDVRARHTTGRPKGTPVGLGPGSPRRAPRVCRSGGE